jgi:hypothetical protein
VWGRMPEKSVCGLEECVLMDPKDRNRRMLEPDD